MKSSLKKQKLKAQVKSRFYYLFWGIATISVVGGQLLVSNGYNKMTEQIEQLNNILIENSRSNYNRYPKGSPVPDIILLWYIRRLV